MSKRTRKTTQHVLTVNQAAMEIDWHPDKIRAMASRGQFPPAIPEGDDWVIVRSRLDRWMSVGAT